MAQTSQQCALVTSGKRTQERHALARGRDGHGDQGRRSSAVSSGSASQERQVQSTFRVEGSELQVTFQSRFRLSNCMYKILNQASEVFLGMNKIKARREGNSRLAHGNRRVQICSAQKPAEKSGSFFLRAHGEWSTVSGQRPGRL